MEHLVRARGAPAPAEHTLQPSPRGRRLGWVSLGLLAGLLAGGGLVRADAVAPSSPAGFVALSPQRVMDTRTGLGVAAAPIGPGAVARLDLSPYVPADATAVVLNVTELSATSGSFLTVYPDGDPRPDASNLNWTDAGVRPNLVTVRLGGRAVLFFNGYGQVDVLADLAGYYQPVGQQPGPIGFSAVGVPQTLSINALATEGSAQLVARRTVPPGRYLLDASVQVTLGDAATDLGCYFGAETAGMTFSAPGIPRVNTAKAAVVQVLDTVVSTASPEGAIVLSCKAYALDGVAHQVHVEFAQVNIQQVSSLNAA